MAELAPITFLRGTPPFDTLPPERFAAVAGALEVAFFPAGTELARAGGAPLAALHVIRTGAARILRERRTVEILERGETFGYTSLLTGAASFDVRADEDLLAYLVPGAVFRELLGDGAFAAWFAAGLSRRLHRALHRTAEPVFRLDLAREVGTLASGKVTWVREDATVGEAARAMRDARVSAVLVASVPPAIVTDRDFRNRVLAERRGASLPVMAVASRPLRTVEASAPLHAVWSALLDAGVHHLPLVRGGEIVGLVTSSELLRATVAGPVGLLRSVQRIGSRAELPGQAERIAEMADALLAGGLDAPAIGGFVARIVDALLGRMAGWAEEELGPPPGPWAYVVLGPEGRREQPLTAGRDHGVVASPGADLAWYRSLATALDRDLEAAGFTEARGRAPAAVDGLEGWIALVERAAGSPGAEGPLLDLRRAAGELDLAPLEDAIDALAARREFQRALREHALRFTPGERLGEEPVDLEAANETFVRLARAEALAAGARVRGTLERLASVAAAGRLSAPRHAALADAFRFLSALRLRFELRRLTGRRPAPGGIEPDALEPADRANLKNAFRAVRAWQQKIAARGEEG